MPASTVQEDNLEILDRIIPKDPNFPSIAYQAHEHVPICVPWVHNVIALGTGFESSVAANPKTDQIAFRPRALAATPGKAQYQLEPTDNTNSFRQNSSTHSATSYEHMDMKGSLSVGGSMLGLSGRAAFSKNVFENKDSNKVSLQASLRIGRITSTASPRLSDYALSLLHDSPTEFHRVYGDYFLGALYLGADTSTFLSSSSSVDLKAEMKEIQVQAKFLGMKKTLVDKRTSSQSNASDYNITFDGFDTLDGTVQNAKAKDMQSYMMIKEQRTLPVELLWTKE
ncbi:hypothetical protein K435DRAFT_836405 [Dendrothele bispora CBS 962.96]|uniref:MACPF domain-containing protein n=1 Tax=Dendrothele bispora (strain CBS 962.96) TaxID=1314807 RepID=A0A4S8MIJ0_DENBC|nr:hypothetical protein K435DRAFT_836405 [Dendrothele bispora CBS 962.96]